MKVMRVVLGVVFLTPAAQAATTCGMIQLGIEGGTYVQTHDNNDLGVIVGNIQYDESVPDYDAWVWEANKVRLLPHLDGAHHSANAINNNGQIVGTSDEASGVVHAVIWDQRGITKLGSLVESSPNWWDSLSEAYDINDTGRAVGTALAADGRYHAVVWFRGRITDLNLLLGAASSTATAINNKNQIVGSAEGPDGRSRGFLFEAGTTLWLGGLGGGGAYPTGINEKGQVVGSSTTKAGKMRAFLWQNGAIKGLGTLGGDHSAAKDINNSGQIVGWADVAGTTWSRDRPFSWKEGVMTNLGTLYPGSGGWALSVNSKGQVVGSSSTFPAVIGRAWRWKKPC